MSTPRLAHGQGPAGPQGRRALLLWVLGLCACLAGQADDQHRSILTFGTVTSGAAVEPAAYVVWEPIGFHQPGQHAFAVYSKPGEPSSAEPYAFQGVARIQTSPGAIQDLLTRSLMLGQDLAVLEGDLDEMFAGIIPLDTFGVAQKLFVVLRGSLQDQRHFHNLLLLSRLHPGVRLCLGLGHAEPIPGPAGTKRTFEIRTHDLSIGRDLAVVGRVTLTAGAPMVLPAPGRPIEIPEATPKGHLNARFRWATPDDLRRVSVLQFGFNVYRIDATFATAQGWDLVPPDTGTLLGLVADGTVAHRVNLTPILTSRLFSPAEAANLLFLPEVYYFADDNERFNPEGPFPAEVFFDGAGFYYYVTARDLLGRDGAVSAGTLVTICDRMPPLAPRRLRVENSFHFQQVQQGNQIVMQEDQRLLVSWQQTPPEEGTVAYYVYRWNSLPEKNELLVSGAAQPIAGPIAHVPGEERLSYRDDGPGAPAVHSQAGKTIWYTVVAMDDGACGGNFSPHSAPAFGVLRDWAGPRSPEDGGGVHIVCLKPKVEWLPPGENTPYPNLNPDRRFFRLEAQRLSASIAWAEFFVTHPPNTDMLSLGKVFFEAGTEVGSLMHEVELTPALPSAIRQFHCQVGTFGGQVSELASTTFIEPLNERHVLRVQFLATIEELAAGRECPVHDPNPADGGTDDAINPIVIDLFFPAKMREWRLYRRIDTGPVTLLRQGNGHPEIGDVQAMIEDYDLPANAARICYYVQYLDQHGNPGPMTRIDCVETTGRTPLPTPILKPLISAGTEDQPQVRMEWFCAPHGVERFQVWILGLPVAVAPELTETMALVEEHPVPLNVPQGGQLLPKFRVFKTPRIGPGFGQPPMFSVQAEILPGNRYVVFVRALDQHGKSGPKSNTESWVWLPAVDPTEDVAWPARPLPAVNDATFPDVVARVIESGQFGIPLPFEGVGIRIGEVPDAYHLTQTPNVLGAIPGNDDPVEYLYRSTVNQEPILGLVAYRAMVPNEAFPQVSGDVIQVTPFMEEIAFRRQTLGLAPVTVIYDPFIRLFPDMPTLSGPHGIYLLDTQPLLQGAQYQYLLVRFNHITREIAEVIIPDTVEIPGE